VGDFVRSIFVYENREEFLGLFLWCGLIALGMVGYAKLQGDPLAAFDYLILFWGSMSVLTWAGLKWDWLGARWLGVLCLVSFACVAWFFNLLLREVTFSTFFGFVIVGWAIQLARMDFAKEDLQHQLMGTHLILAGFLGAGVDPPPEVGEAAIEAALAYHLRKHDCAWEVCDQDPCPEARELQGFLTKMQAPGFREEFQRLAHEQAHREQAEASEEDTSAP
jgi:hypothetical protein